MRDEDKWRCPWCRRIATTVRLSICDSRKCDCGAIAVGAPEGDWDEVMAASKKCHETVHGMGVPRIGTTIRMGTRTDREQSMQDKIDSVHAKME